MDDLTLCRFGMLVCVAEAERHRTPAGKLHRAYRCICDCGAWTTVLAASLRAGRTKSCGCGAIAAAKKPKTHGYGARTGRCGTYTSWAQMRSRCNNPNVPEFKNYGGRGIKVCERWESFENFLADMGERPQGSSIDRIDVNSGYEPGNCRWATRQQQSMNTRRTRLIAADGVVMSLTEWSYKSGLSTKCIASRLRRGWSAERAVGRG